MSPPLWEIVAGIVFVVCFCLGACLGIGAIVLTGMDAIKAKAKLRKAQAELSHIERSPLAVYVELKEEH